MKFDACAFFSDANILLVFFLFTFTTDWEMYVAAIHSIYIYYINKKGRKEERKLKQSHTHISIFQLLQRIFQLSMLLPFAKKIYIFAFIQNTETIIVIIIKIKNKIANSERQEYFNSGRRSNNNNKVRHSVSFG